MVACEARRYLLLALMVLAAGCSGAAKPALQQEKAPSPGAAVLLMSESLPPLPTDRDTSSTRFTEVDGVATFDRASNAIDNGDALRLLSGTDDPAWGIWRFNPPLATVSSVFVDIDGHPGDVYYVALSDYSRGAWEFSGPLASGETVEVDEARHRSAAGNVYLAVVAHSGSQPTVYRLVMTTEDGWVIVTVDDAHNVGWYTSLAVIGGKPAISYSDMYQSDLKFASSSTATGHIAADWSVTTVDSTGFVGTHTSLAEVAGQPAISYLDDSNDALKYARLDYLPLKTWVKVAVHTSDIGEDVGQYTSLAVVNGLPLITYYDAGIGYLRHAQSITATGMNEADWQKYVTDNYDDVGHFSSLAVVDGQAAVSYCSDSQVSVRYKWFPNPAKVDVCAPNGKAYCTSLAVVNGKPAISWYDSGDDTLNYSFSSTARGTSNLDWNTIAIPSHEIAGMYSSLAVINGRPAIGYRIHNLFPDTYHLALSWSSTAGGENPSDWITIVVDDNVDTGHFASLAEVDGRPAISYHEADSGSLKYAIRMGP